MPAESAAIVVLGTMRPKDPEELVMFFIDACIHVSESVNDPAVCTLVWVLTTIPLHCEQFRNARTSYRDIHSELQTIE